MTPGMKPARRRAPSGPVLLLSRRFGISGLAAGCTVPCERYPFHVSKLAEVPFVRWPLVHTGPMSVLSRAVVSNDGTADHSSWTLTPTLRRRRNHRAWTLVETSEHAEQRLVPGRRSRGSDSLVWLGS